MHLKNDTETSPTPSGLQRFFKLQQHGTTVNREIIAGLTTFTTMSYIVVVNPAILKNAGIPPEPSMVATVLASVFGCLLMAFYANRPFAIAPYMGENAFIAFTVCGVLGYKWQTALAAIFIAGVIFVLLTLFRLRTWMVESVPLCLRYSFAVGIGLFLSFIGLNQTEIVVLGVPGAPVHAGALTSRPVLVAIFGFVLISILIIRKVYGAILIGIVVTAFVAYAIPPQAYGPALIVVGLFMLAPIRRIDFEDYSESVPSFAVVALTCFTYNIAIGITAGFVLYPLCKLVAGKAREIRPGLWLLTALSLLFFVFYPYR